MIKKSVSQQASRLHTRTASQPSTYTSILLSRPGRKSFSQPYLGQAMTGSRFNTLLVIQPPRSVIQQSVRHTVSHKGGLKINRAVKSISYLALSNQAVNQPSSFWLRRQNTRFTSAMSSSPSVFSPHTAENPTVQDSEVGCCCRTAASDSPHDPQSTHPLGPRCHLHTHTWNTSNLSFDRKQMQFIFFRLLDGKLPHMMYVCY